MKQITSRIMPKYTAVLGCASLFAISNAQPGNAVSGTLGCPKSPSSILGYRSKMGQELEFFRPGDPVVNPESKVVIGREDDVVLGTYKIRTLQKGLTVAIAIVEGEVRLGDAMRLKSR